MSVAEASLEAPGLFRYGWPFLHTPAAPAAGANFSYTVPGQYLVQPLSVHVRLVASADAADREVVVEYQTAAGERFDLNGVATTVTASQTADYVFSAYQAVGEFTVASSALVPLHPVILVPTEILKITVVNIQATDQLSLIRIRWQQYESNSPVPGA